MVAQTRRRGASSTRPASATTKASTGTDTGSSPLSEPFVATVVPGPSGGGMVMEPVGSHQLTVTGALRRSTRQATPGPSTVASAMTHPAQSARPVPKKSKTVRLLKGSAGRVVPSEDGAGFRDGALARKVQPALTGLGNKDRKRNATSDAPGAIDRGHATPKLASATDYPASHWEESVSGTIPPAPSPIPSSQVPTPSPMKVDKGKRRADPEPYSSPTDADPLLAKRSVAHNGPTFPVGPIATSTPHPSGRIAPNTLLSAFVPTNGSRTHISNNHARSPAFIPSTPANDSPTLYNASHSHAHYSQRPTAVVDNSAAYMRLAPANLHNATHNVTTPNVTTPNVTHHTAASARSAGPASQPITHAQLPLSEYLPITACDLG
jgi:hypothetical protein